MGDPSLLNHAGLFHRNEKGIHDLSGRAGKLLQGTATLKRSIGPVLMVLAVLLGLTANHLSRKAALATWEQEHGPSGQLVSDALSALGYRQPQLDNEAQHKALRNLPPGLEASVSSWLSDDGKWAAFFPKEEAEVRLFCLSCASPPKSWESFGRGWAGFERLLSLARQQPGEIPMPDQKHGALKEDYRQIRY